MGCKPGNRGTTSCYYFQPGTGAGVSIEFTEYPLNVIRTNGSYNIPGREGSVVMYPSTQICNSSGSPQIQNASNCGKLWRADPEDNECILAYDWYPGELSFDYGFSDTWFSYLYDTSDKQGIIGSPCFYIEDEVTTGDDGSMTSSSEWHPCTGFTGTPASTTLSYTVEGDDDLTGDSDCPHPTLFGFGSDKNKLAFSYDSLSTTIPNGLTDFSLSADGTTYTDAWNQDEVSGIIYSSTQNPWVSGDESFNDFQVFEINDTGNNKTGLRIKFNIYPIFDDSGSSTVFTGTKWEPTEVLNPGTGYAVNDTFNLQYLVTHYDNTTTTLQVTLKITGVGPYQATEGQTGFDVLRAGDTINGHTINRVFTTDLDNFPYHIIYLDGNGSDFAKDTQYTSSRNHVITAKAGKGIAERAILVGKYEFLNKSIQYCTADVDKNAPNIFSTLKQPKITPNLTNGVLSGVSIVDGGSGWLAQNIQGREPELIVTPPLIDSGRQAKVKAEFTNGVLTAIKVEDGGSGYSTENLPQFAVINDEKRESITIFNEAGNTVHKEDSTLVMDAIDEYGTDFGVSGENRTDISNTIDLTPERQDYTIPDETFRVKEDPNRNRVSKLPQQKYTKAATDKYKEETKVQYDLQYLNDIDIDRKYKDEWEIARQEDIAQRVKDVDDISQENAIEYDVRKEMYVETVQGATSQLPHASEYTKYMLRQYRPDPTRKTTINVTLASTPVTAGCTHFSCTAPPPGTGGSTTDPETGGTYNTTYTMSSLMGSGCKAWSCSGTFPMYNDLSASARQVADATAAYGNPYSQ